MSDIDHSELLEDKELNDEHAPEINDSLSETEILPIAKPVTKTKHTLNRDAVIPSLTSSNKENEDKCDVKINTPMTPAEVSNQFETCFSETIS